jgi:transcriptional regulator with XRE-family HTH domain
MTGDQIRAARKRKGWTQDQLAQAAEISQPMLSMVESGTAQPSGATLNRIAAALGLQVKIALVEQEVSPEAAVSAA